MRCKVYIRFYNSAMKKYVSREVVSPMFAIPRKILMVEVAFLKGDLTLKQYEFLLDNSETHVTYQIMKNLDDDGNTEILFRFLLGEFDQRNFRLDYFKNHVRKNIWGGVLVTDSFEAKWESQNVLCASFICRNDGKESKVSVRHNAKTMTLYVTGKHAEFFDGRSLAETVFDGNGIAVKKESYRTNGFKYTVKWSENVW